MDFAKLKANGDAALAQISNALDDLQYSPDQRPVPILHLAMDYVRDMLAILATASEQAPVAWEYTYYDEDCDIRQVDLSPCRFLESWQASKRECFERPLYSSPAHTSEARDAARLDWLVSNEFDLVTRREDIGEDEYAIWWFVVDYRKSTARSIHTVSGHPLGSPREAIDAAMRQEAE